jgi:hypothetical protein
MRTLLSIALVAGTMVTTACTPKTGDNTTGNQGVYPGVPVGPTAPRGSDIPAPARYGQLPDSFRVKQLKIGATSIDTVRTTPGTNRDDLETVRITCLDNSKNARSSSLDGVVLIDGSEIALIGNFSKRKPHTLLTCSDNNLRDDRRVLRHRSQNERRLQLGQQLVVKIKSSRNRFRREEMIPVVVSCIAHPGQAAEQGLNGIGLTRGSKILIGRNLLSVAAISCE